MNNIAFIDIQGFRCNETFIPKEIYVKIYPENLKFHAIIKSPFSIKKLSSNCLKQTRWLTDHYHGIKWSDGSITLSNFLEIIEKPLQGKEILCKGVEKTEWLRMLLNKNANECQNMEEYNCKIKLSEHLNRHLTCMYHMNKNHHCAITNVEALVKWFVDEKFK